MGNKCCTCKEAVEEQNEHKSLVPPPYSLPEQSITERKVIPIDENNDLEDDSDGPTPTFNKAVFHNHNSSGISLLTSRHKL